MIPGPIKNFECPKCKNIMSKNTLKSGNTFGAKLYSDGKQIARMFPAFPLITKCSKCNTIFWLNSETKTETKNPNGFNWANFLTISELFSALILDENSKKENEIIIRRKIWWAFNDRLRNNKEFFNSVEEKKLWEENIYKLIPLLDNNIIEERITIAELYRNIGDFEKCLEIIETIPEDEFDWLIKLFKEQIQKKNTMLFNLN